MSKLTPSSYRDYLHARTRSILGSPFDQRITLRGFWVGSFLSLFLALAAPYNNMKIHGTMMALDISTQGALFLFLVLIGVLNLILKVAGSDLRLALPFALLVTAGWLQAHWPLAELDPHSLSTWFSTFLLLSALINLPLAVRGRSLALNKAELIMVYVMLIIVSSVCTMGLSQQLLPLMSALFYFMSPENGWEQKLLPWLGDKPYMVNDGADNRLFYEGVQDLDQAIPYGVWVEPLLWWAALLLALYVVMVCLTVILRRQWMERERLAYPLAQVGLALIRGDEQGNLVNGFFKSRAAWIGMSVPMIVGSLRALGSYGFPVVAPTTGWSLTFLGSPVALNLSFSLVGFAYFIDTRVAASVWIFYLLSRFQMALMKTLGIKAEHAIHYGANESPFMAYAGLGGLICMVVVGLYVGREHLGNVIRKAFGRAPELDDGDEILSYRSAVVGTAGGLAVIVGWFWIMGTPPLVALLFAVVALLIFIGITRIVVEAGVATLQTPMIAPDFIIYGLGSNLVGAPGVANLSMAYVWSSEIRAFVMAVCANALRLIQEMERGSRRIMFWTIIMALGIGVIGSMWMVLSLGYRYGGINLGGYFFIDMNKYNYQAAVLALQPSGPYWAGHGFFALGAAFMGLLMWARQSLVWWPLHPIGFPLSATGIMSIVAFSAFVAWAIKLLLLRLGGPNLYQRAQTFFLGLIAGQVLCNGFWLVVDYFTGHTGNAVLTF